MPYAGPSSPTATIPLPSPPPPSNALSESLTSDDVAPEPLNLSDNSLKLDLRRLHSKSKSTSGLIYLRPSPAPSPIPSTSNSTLSTSSFPSLDSQKVKQEEEEEGNDLRRIRLYGHGHGLKLKLRSESRPESLSQSSKESLNETNFIPFPKTSTSSPVIDDIIDNDMGIKVNMNGLVNKSIDSKVDQDESNTVTFPSLGDKSPGLHLDLSTVDRSVFPRSSTPMVRKKSGELVKPSLKSCFGRTKSAPSTPGGTTKAVHFDSQLEHVKLFLSQQKPTAISREGSPIETETEDDTEFPFGSSSDWTISRTLTNFPPMTEQRINSDVYLESLDIASDNKSLRGIVVVKNLSFSKWICARFSFDNWQTVSEVSAEYIESIRNSTYDKFGFNIKLVDVISKIEDKKLFLCIRYTVGGKEIWDSNSGGNYQVEFSRKKKSTVPLTKGHHPPSSPSRHTWSVRSEKAAELRAAEIRKELDRLVDDDSDAGLTPIPWKTFKPSANTFATRYDFGTSLKSPARPASKILDNPYFASLEERQPISSSSMGKSFNNNTFVERPNVERPRDVGRMKMEFKDGMPAMSIGESMSPMSNFGDSMGTEFRTGYFDGMGGGYGSPPFFYGGSGQIHRPPSPPQEIYFNYSSLLKEEEKNKAVSSRFNSFPASSSSSSSKEHLPIPPLFRPPASPSPSPQSTSPRTKKITLPSPVHSLESIPSTNPTVPKRQIRSSLESDVPQKSLGNISPLHHEVMLLGGSPMESPRSNGSSSTIISSPDTKVGTPPLPSQLEQLSREGERPPMGSIQYDDFVDKFCFYQKDSEEGFVTPSSERPFGTPPSSGEGTPMMVSPLGTTAEMKDEGTKESVPLSTPTST